MRKLRLRGVRSTCPRSHSTKGEEGVEFKTPDFKFSSPTDEPDLSKEDLDTHWHSHGIKTF